MIIVIECSAPHPYIAGVFSETSAANTFFDSMPADRREHASMRTILDASLPTFMTQDKRGFTFLRADEVLNELQTHSAQRRDDEWCYTNLYRIDDVFVPTVPGEDEMGSLRHGHIGNAHLDKVAAEGLDAL